MNREPFAIRRLAQPRVQAYELERRRLVPGGDDGGGELQAVGGTERMDSQQAQRCGADCLDGKDFLPPRSEVPQPFQRRACIRNAERVLASRMDLNTSSSVRPLLEHCLEQTRIRAQRRRTEALQVQRPCRPPQHTGAFEPRDPIVLLLPDRSTATHSLKPDHWLVAVQDEVR